MIKLYNFDELKPEEILNRDIRAEKNVEDVVDAIIADVRARGDEALKEYALKFDGAQLEDLQVTRQEMDDALASMDPYFLETLRQAAANIEHFHRHRKGGSLCARGHGGVPLHSADGCDPRQGGRGVRDRYGDPRRERRNGRSGDPCCRCHRRGDKDLQDRRSAGGGGAGIRHPDYPGGG